VLGEELRFHSGSTRQGAKVQNELDPHELKAALEAGERLIVVDVREPWEFQMGHLADATNLPMSQLGNRLDDLDVENEHVLYCHHGVRSLHATMALAQRGFKVRSLRGGIDRWSEVIDPSIPRY
jgi:adenylyltransferase/sulfurtransferase